VILPIFALANTGIVVGRESLDLLVSANSFGIGLGLFIGKPIGIFLASFAAVAARICRLPLDLSWRHIFGAGLLGGIGFTMSIFITNLAFAGDMALIDESKLVILLASLCSGIVGFLWLRSFGQPLDTDEDLDTMDFAE
jgi:NhaA family Na+:H+ antiporter